MKILFDLQHPAHFHFFKNLIKELESEKHDIYITGRDKDILKDLVINSDLKVDFFGKAQKGVFNLFKELLLRQWRLLKIIKKFKPDLLIAIAGTYIAFPGKIKKIPTFVFYDTEHAFISNLLSYPFAKCVYIPDCYRKKIRWNHVRYNGYHELAYLHPRYFNPDISVLDDLGIKKGEIFSILRFVNWGAAHDIGLKGITNKDKIQTVKELEKYGKVFISSEEELPSELEKYRLKINVLKMHSLLAFAALVFGESATMASEGAVLGVPAIYIDPIGRGYTDELEMKYGIVFNFNDKEFEKSISKANEILSNYQFKKWKTIRDKIIIDKIDVTKMLLRIVKKNN